VLAFGPQAEVIASTGAKDRLRGVIVAARHGRGRVLAFGHGAFLGGWQAQGLMADAIAWAGGRELEHTSLFVLGSGTGLERALAERVDALQRAQRLPGAEDLAEFDAVAWVSGDLADQDLDALAAYVSGGGGLLFGVCPWGRQQIWDGQGEGRSIRSDLSHNRLARRFGLVFGASTAGGEELTLDRKQNRELHAGRAVERVLEALSPENREGESRSAEAPADAERVMALLAALPPGDSEVLPRIEGAIAKVKLASHVPRQDHATLAADTVGRLAMSIATNTWKELPPESVPAAPGAEFFPGAVPASAERITRELHFDAEATNNGGWLSTGLYAEPGEVLHLATTRGKPAGWSLRIGAHRDTLWAKDKWSRWPEVTLERPIAEGGQDDFASPFGGLVYLVPGRGAAAAGFALSNVVEAPFFDLRVESAPAHSRGKQGDGGLADWPRRRGAPAPWGELACNGVILTLPAGALRQLEDPTALMQWWDKAMACYPELRGEPQPARPERLVEDLQISAGWMHSGYPVMTHGARDREHSAACELASLRTKGNWGYFHEFGHNAQKREWTFSGTGEVTNNLFSLYLGERMAGIEPWNNPWLENQKDKPAAYFAAGADFEQWKKSPGLALMMYARVQHEFGWQPFKDALRSYLALPAKELPLTDGDKHDRWLIELSRATGRNLGPYFQKWGVPTTSEARASVADLKRWMPQ